MRSEKKPIDPAGLARTPGCSEHTGVVCGLLATFLLAGGVVLGADGA